MRQFDEWPRIERSGSQKAHITFANLVDEPSLASKREWVKPVGQERSLEHWLLLTQSGGDALLG